MFYAADNSYATESSAGFSNTWYVLVFDTKQNRDLYVENSASMAAQAITRKQVISYAANWDIQKNRYIEPKKFTRERWAILDNGWQYEKLPKGYIGKIGIFDPDNGYEKEIRPFY